jgi:Tfp pilus assembly protein PilF
MISRKLNVPRLVCKTFLLFFILIFSGNVLASTITGYVYNKQRSPLNDVDVELLNEYYQLRGRTKTDGTGRYQFGGLPDGYYTVRILPFRYGYKDQSQLIEINTINARGTGGGNGYFTMDFYLSPRKGSLIDTETGVIFAQEVPEEARQNYENGVKKLSKNQTSEGVEQLREAIKIFPTYYEALNHLGKELVRQEKYGEAAQLFIRAAEVNSKSAVAFYYMGYSLNKLGKDFNKAALAALNQASLLAPESLQVLYILGKVEREEGKFDLAETHLIKAKKLSDDAIPEIHKELSQLYGNDLKKYKEAAQELELYIKVAKLSKEDEKNVKKLIADLKKKADLE